MIREDFLVGWPVQFSVTTYHVITHLRPPRRALFLEEADDMEENGEELKDSELSRFLAKVEEVGEIHPLHEHL